MAEKFTDIDDYISSFPAEVQSILTNVRAAMHEALPGSGEKISYNIAAITLNDKSVVHFAAWSQYISVYPIPETSGELADQLAPHVAGKGTLRFQLDEPIPYSLIKTVTLLLAEQRH